MTINNNESNRYVIWFCRDKSADMLGYNNANRFVSKNYDPKLYAEAQKIDATHFATIEEAEKVARDFAKKLFVYDHTKRPKVMTDFRVYRWWILDASIPDYDHWSNKYKATVKKGKADFSKEEDPSGGKIAEKIAKQKALDKIALNAGIDHRAKLYDIPNAFFDDDFSLNHGTVVPMDSIPYSHRFDPSFYKDSLNLPDEFSIIIPAKGFFNSFRYDEVYNPDKVACGRGFVLLHCQITFECKFRFSEHESSNYSRSLVGVFKTVESASIYAALNGWQQPMAFKSKNESYFSEYLAINYSERSPATIYRLMVESGMRKPIAKFKIENDGSLKKTA